MDENNLYIINIISLRLIDFRYYLLKNFYYKIIGKEIVTMDDYSPISEIERNIDKALVEQFKIINEIQSNCTFFKFLSMILLVSLCIETALLFAITR